MGREAITGLYLIQMGYYFPFPLSHAPEIVRLRPAGKRVQTGESADGRQIWLELEWSMNEYNVPGLTVEKSMFFSVNCFESLAEFWPRTFYLSFIPWPLASNLVIVVGVQWNFYVCLKEDSPLAVFPPLNEVWSFQLYRLLKIPLYCEPVFEDHDASLLWRALKKYIALGRLIEACRNTLKENWLTF